MIVAIVAALLGLASSSALAQTGTVTGTVLSAKDNKPLAYANVMIVGTTMGAMSLSDGKFEIKGVPIGVYTVRAMMMGFGNAEKPGVVVNAGATATVAFKLDEKVVATVPDIVVTADKAMVEVTSTEVRSGVTSEQVLDMPVDDVVDAIGLKAGIVKTGDDMHVRGGRSNEVQIQIDGVPVSDPLGGGSVDVGMLGTSGSEIVSGGMDAEYGDAQSAVINIATKEGGATFGGEVRYFTDDFGRSDKTYTNFDRLSLGFGGPTWWKNLRYYISGEATWGDTENTTIEPREEHKITDWLKFRQRQTSAYNVQGKLTYKMARMKVDGEAIYSQLREDDYINNWNIEGYVSKVWYFQGLVVAGPPVNGREQFQFDRLRSINHGPWADEKDPNKQAAQLNVRPVDVIDLVRDPNTGQQYVVTYYDYRAADFRFGSQVVTVVWDEAVQGPGGSVSYKPWALFEGFQRGASDFKPFLTAPQGADSSYVPFNSSTTTPETRAENLQLKLGFSHNITSKLLYTLKLSRLDLRSKSSVLDEFGEQKDPASFSTAGLPVTLPDGTYLNAGVSNAVWYTDDDFPYFVTAYDYPFYSDQHSLQYLFKGDVVSDQFKGHRIKTGLQVLYNDLNDDERVNPALTRIDEYGRVQQGLNVNTYENYNAEGAVYIQDKWDYEGMVVNGGLRYEWFTVGNNSQVQIASSEIDQSVDEFKWNLSPRLGVAFPITDRDKFFFHYGRFTQWPSRFYLFRTQDPVGSTGTLGNPNLEPELTVSYQAGISHQFTDDIAANFVVFNKDIYGLISSTRVTDDSTGVQAFRFINRTYASSRGVELSLEKRLTRRLGFEVYYTYSFADGVASDSDFGRSAEGLTHLPTEEYPLNWDQRNTFNVTLRLQDRNKWGATMIYQYGSGLPWTPVDRFARLNDPTWENSRRLEPTHKLSIQGRKLFNVYGRELTLFFEGRNLLDEDVLLPNGDAPTAFPGLVAANMDNGSYLTETGEYGGAYLQDTDADGRDDFNPVFDPTIWETHRLWRLGLGFEF
ncbi:MAG: TonB-dependent receptor [Candidatus Latescibacteria bacterium]|nr:TonB-dependent receptor [Candidatus Latescibacterota bacterium]